MKESVVFTYGRFNPPHLGHKMMIEEMMKLNKKVVVVVSHSQDKEKNPLSVADKIRILKTWFPKLDVRASSKTTPIAKIAENFAEDSVMVVGEDRGTTIHKVTPKNSIQSIAKRYGLSENVVKSKKFKVGNNIKLPVSSFTFIKQQKKIIKRPPGAPSATKARNAARTGKIATFRNLTGYNNEKIIKKIRGSPNNKKS